MMQPMQQIAGRTQDATQQLIVPAVGLLDAGAGWSLESGV